jgi:sulfite reductase (NADPH) flavoprotein alpha-component
MVTVKRVETIADHDGQVVRQVVFDIAGTGIRYQPGDRCGVLPENSDELVDKTLDALNATGDEIIHLNGAWRWHVNLRDGYQSATELPLRTLLKFGRIRPVDRNVALTLYSLTNNARLQHILDVWAEDQWELWDLLNLLAEAGYNTKRLWKAIPGEHEHICRVILPERWRLYSISSIMDDHADELHLTIGELRYATPQTEASQAVRRYGTGSSFLARLAAGDEERQQRISIKVVHPPRFSLPRDASRPVVMFAGGTGISPMCGLIDERMRDPAAGQTWLFFGTRHPEEFYYRDAFAPFVAQGKLNVRVAFSRAETSVQFDPAQGQEGQAQGQFVTTFGQRRHIDGEMLKEENAALLWDMLRSTQEGGQGAYFFLCGRTAFANTVLETIKTIIARYAVATADESSEEIARRTLYQLIGQDRLMMEIFTTYAGAHFETQKPQFDISEVVLHNDDEHGYWIIISGRVYDVNEFNYIHPGGAKIIQSYSGMDATLAYQKIEHHTNSEVDAMLGMYEIGVLRPLEFGQEWGVALSDQGMRVITLRDAYFAWVDLLFMVTEIENAILNDFRIRHEPFTDIEHHGRVLLTPSKIEQLGLAHERLVTSYLEHVLGSPLPTLWAMTAGLLGWQNADAQWMHKTLAALQATPVAQEANQLARRLREQLQQDEQRLTAGDAYFVDKYGAICDLLEQEDRRAIRALKLALREGVMVFEELEHHTIRQSGDRLGIILQSIPKVLAEFYSRLQVQTRV